MNILEFMGKVIFEDLPQLVFEKAPESIEDAMDNLSNTIDKMMDN